MWYSRIVPWASNFEAKPDIGNWPFDNLSYNHCLYMHIVLSSLS